MLTVSKFGGSSLAGADGSSHASKICHEILRQGSALAVVVSARGDTTDELLSEAASASPSPHPRELDALLSTGELRSAAVFAMILRDMGIDAVSLTAYQAGIRTTDRFGEADILSFDTAYIRSLLSAGKVPVICGFQGIDSEGSITTLGRGGSDTTAVALAAALCADECRIYTDVDGVFTADPSAVPDARLIPRLDFYDMLTLSRFGCGVLHHRAALTAMRENLSLRILSAFTSGEGTIICPLPYNIRSDFAGLASDSRGTVTVVGRAAGYALREQTEYALRREGFTPLGFSYGENHFGVSLPIKEADTALRFLHGELFG